MGFKAGNNIVTDGLVFQTDSANKIGAFSQTEIGASFDDASLQYLSSASTDFNFGDEDFTVIGWVQFDTLSQIQGLFSNWISVARSWLLRQESSNVIRAYISADGSTTAVTVDATTTITNTTDWFLLCLVHDSVNNLVKVSVNDDTFVTAAHSGGVYNGANDGFKLGIQGDIRYFDGGMDRVYVYGKAFSQSEKDAFYNNGAGLKFADADKTSLISAYLLDEATGTRFDAFGSNDLTDVNGVTSRAGLGDGLSIKDITDTTPIDALNGADVVNKLFVTDGVDDFFRANGSVSKVLPATQGTYEVWFTADTVPPVSTSTPFAISHSTTATFIRILWTSTNRVYFWARNNGVDQFVFYIDGTTYWNAGEIHQLVCVQDGTTDSSNPKMYVDGVEVSKITTTSTNRDFWFADNVNWNVISVGRLQQNGSASQQFAGSFANVKVYNKGLSDAEILQNYHATKQRFQ